DLTQDTRVMERGGVTTRQGPSGPRGPTARANRGNATTTAANELIVGANTVFTGNNGAASGFTLRTITNPDGDLVEDKTVTSIGSYNATAPLSGAGPWVMQMVTFK